MNSNQPFCDFYGKLPLIDRVDSIDGIPIRLTTERWFHIVENHDDLAGYYEDVLETVANPELILNGHNKSLIAVRNFGRRKYLFVVYRQVSRDDGFIVTAYFSSKLDRTKAIWKQS